jgi:hypothetical protein
MFDEYSSLLPVPGNWYHTYISSFDCGIKVTDGVPGFRVSIAFDLQIRFVSQLLPAGFVLQTRKVQQSRYLAKSFNEDKNVFYWTFQ